MARDRSIPGPASPRALPAPETPRAPQALTTIRACLALAVNLKVTVAEFMEARRALTIPANSLCHGAFKLKWKLNRPLGPARAGE